MDVPEPDASQVARYNDAGGANQRKRRILMTTSTLPRWPGDSEPPFILQLAQSLSADFDVTVLAPHCSGASREETIGPVHIHRYRYAPKKWENLAYQGGMLQRLREKSLRWLLVPAFLLAQMRAVRRLHRQQHFDLIHAHWILPQGLVAAALKRLTAIQTPILLTSHGGDLFSLKRFDRVKRWVLTSMDRVSVVSRSMLPICDSLGLPRENVFVRSMGVSLRDRFFCSEHWEQREGLIFVGRLVEKKGVDTLLKAFALLQTEFPDQQLTIVGDGPLRQALERLAETSGCRNHVSFLGAVPNEKVPPHLNRARIAVVPSVVASDGDQEGLGLVAVEAMGCGCAVVCSDLPALEDVVTDSETGLMFAAGDEIDLTKKLKELLNNPERASKLAMHGREKVNEHFDWSAVADAYSAHYEELIEAVNADTG